MQVEQISQFFLLYHWTLNHFSDEYQHGVNISKAIDFSQIVSTDMSIDV